MYAILDIETTGGKYNEEGITEIAIYRFDGHEIVDQFASLVNPQKKIQPFVVQLTGINNQMLRSAPKFHEVARRIVEITEGCILIAHNAKFDSRILSTEFSRLGYNYQRNTICTVQLSRQLLPAMPSYSLGNLTKSLGIPIKDRHRAQGDAYATVTLFKLLLNKDKDKEIIKSFINAKDSQANRKTKLLKLVETAPPETGVYYLHNTDGTILYIGQSRNIRKRINQLFTSTTTKNKKLQKEVVKISYALTGSSLIARLKVEEDILNTKPKYTRRSKKALLPYQLVQRKDADGYLNLRIEKTDLRKRPIMTFKSLSVARQNLIRITEEFDLSYEKNALPQVKVGKEKNESVKDYNTRVQSFLDKYLHKRQTQLLIDKGREVGEHSVIFLKNGIYKGYGFYTLNHQITKSSILEKILVVSENDRYARHIIDDYLMESNVQKTLPITIDDH